MGRLAILIGSVFLAALAAAGEARAHAAVPPAPLMVAASDDTSSDELV